MSTVTKKTKIIEFPFDLIDGRFSKQMMVRVKPSRSWESVINLIAEKQGRSEKTLLYSIQGVPIDLSKNVIDLMPISLLTANGNYSVEYSNQRDGWLECRSIPGFETQYVGIDDTILSRCNAGGGYISYDTQINHWTDYDVKDNRLQIIETLHYDDNNIYTTFVVNKQKNAYQSIICQQFPFHHGARRTKILPSLTKECKVLFGIKPTHNFVCNVDIFVCPIDGETIHIIGADKKSLNLTHYEWNLKSNKCTMIHEFESGKCYGHGICLIYLKMRRELWMIGGEKTPTASVWRFDGHLDDRLPMGIWKCSFNDEYKWMKIDENFNHKYVNCSTTKNENYIIIAGGHIIDGKYGTGSEGSKKLFVLDVRNNNYTLKESLIELPLKGKCRIVTMGGIRDELLVCGWTKETFKQREFSDMTMIPFYLIQLLLFWYNQEMVHWFYNAWDDANDVTKHRHQTIKLSSIYNNVKLIE